MLEQFNKTKHKWGGYHSMIDRWLEDRRQLLITFCGMFKQDEVNHLSTLPDEKTLADFCQQLVDYLSLGHFEVYESLVAECNEKSKASLELAHKLYPEITKTTDTLLAFNDKYDAIKTVEDYDVLSDDLSQIGIAIATRIELEDQLIERFYNNY